MVSEPVINFCRSEHISTCAAGNQKEQTGCSFYERSRYADRCMYFIFEEYCDCLRAQLSSVAER
jgi:hypothetical protein